jgi:hypothetical protein
LHQSRSCDDFKQTAMLSYAARRRLKITAGAVTSLVIVGWLAALAIAALSVR